MALYQVTWAGRQCQTKRQALCWCAVNVSEPEKVDGAMTKAVLEEHGLKAAGSLVRLPAVDECAL